MTSKPEIGKNTYKDALTRGRNAANAARQALSRIVDDEPGPQTLALLIAKTALSLGQIEAVLNELDEIGRNARSSAKQSTLKKE